MTKCLDPYFLLCFSRWCDLARELPERESVDLPHRMREDREEDIILIGSSHYRRCRRAYWRGVLRYHHRTRFLLLRVLRGYVSRSSLLRFSRVLFFLVMMAISFFGIPSWRASRYHWLYDELWEFIWECEEWYTSSDSSCRVEYLLSSSEYISYRVFTLLHDCAEKNSMISLFDP